MRTLSENRRDFFDMRDGFVLSKWPFRVKLYQSPSELVRNVEGLLLALLADIDTYVS